MSLRRVGLPRNDDQYTLTSLRPPFLRPPLDVPGLLRLKGVVQTGEADWSEIQFAGRHGSLPKTAPPPEGPAVVAMALRGQLPGAALDAAFGNSADAAGTSR